MLNHIFALLTLLKARMGDDFCSSSSISIGEVEAAVVEEEEVEERDKEVVEEAEAMRALYICMKHALHWFTFLFRRSPLNFTWPQFWQRN